MWNVRDEQCNFQTHFDKWITTHNHRFIYIHCIERQTKKIIDSKMVRFAVFQRICSYMYGCWCLFFFFTSSFAEEFELCRSKCIWLVSNELKRTTDKHIVEIQIGLKLCHAPTYKSHHIHFTRILWKSTGQSIIIQKSMHYIL